MQYALPPPIEERSLKKGAHRTFVAALLLVASPGFAEALGDAPIRVIALKPGEKAEF